MQTQLPLFTPKCILDELQERHPHWLFYANDTRMDVEIPGTQYGTIFVQLVTDPRATLGNKHIDAINALLNRDVQSQLNFQSAFVQY